MSPPEKGKNDVRSNVQQIQCQHRISVSLVFVYWGEEDLPSIVVSYPSTEHVVTTVVVTKKRGASWHGAWNAAMNLINAVCRVCAWNRMYLSPCSPCCGCIIMKYFHKCPLSGIRRPTVSLSG